MEKTETPAWKKTLAKIAKVIDITVHVIALVAVV